jgi:hypothetical protein
MAPKKRERSADNLLTLHLTQIPPIRASCSSVFVGFFRAINIAGHNVIRMQLLVNVMLSCGAARCVTYIQSGNVIFTLLPPAPPQQQQYPGGDQQTTTTITTSQQLSQLKERVLDTLLRDHGIKNTDLVIRSLEELSVAMERCPVVLTPPSDAAGSESTSPSNKTSSKAKGTRHGTVAALQNNSAPATAVTNNIMIPTHNPKHVICYLFADRCIPSGLVGVAAAATQERTTAVSSAAARDSDDAPHPLAESMLRATGKLTEETILFPNRNMMADQPPPGHVAELFIYFPISVVGSKLTIDVAKKCFSAPSAPTARNWLTLCAVRALAESMKTLPK